MNREDDMEYEGDFMNEEYNEYEDFNEQDEEEEKKCNEKNSIFFIEGLDGHIISETEATIKYESLIQSFCKDYQVQEAEQYLFSHAEADWVPSNSFGAQTECEICLNEFTNQNPKIQLPCQHQFCEECMKEYLETSIKAGPPSIFTRCPSCDEILNIKFVKDILMRKPSQLIVKNLYEKFLLDNFVQNSQNFKWCPGPSCSKIFYFPQLKSKSEIKAKNLKCICDYSFCAKCENEAHRPLSCELLTSWNHLYLGMDDNLNKNWLAVNTKPCPKCKSPIQKNEGCMHVIKMTCKNCKYQFCWLCKESWSMHGSDTGGYYKCNRYVENIEELQTLNLKEKQLKKFDFFSNRFTEHKKSVLIAQKKKKRVLDGLNRQHYIPIYIYNFLDYYQIANSNSKEEIFKFAYELIIECRRAIAYSYCVGYYLQLEQKRVYFEFLQHEVEHQLENLDKETDIIDFSQFYDENFNRLNEYYFEFAEKINQKAKILLKYFENILDQLEMDLPEVAVNNKNPIIPLKKQSSFFDPNQIDAYWICTKCTYANKKKKTKCEMCSTKKPNKK